MQPTTPRRKRAASPVLSTPTSASSSEWFLPDFAQAHKLGFSLEKNGSAGVLDFVHKDKTTLSYVCLHSEHQPGRFALIDNYKLVFCGTVASEADFTALLLKHNWQDPKTPVAKAAKKEKEGPKEEKPRREPPHPTEWRSGALAPEIEVLRKFFKLAEGSLLIAHNIAADKKQLEDARKRCGATSDLPNPWFYTLALARARRSKDAACGLGELCLDFGINAVGAHRALRDVEMTFQVLRYFHAQQPITELITSSAKPKAKQASLFPLAA
jgi:hypothetical protein